ncbi:ribonuclease III [Nodosilinea sp. LEGE 07088]|uniref:ribonuclease III n=1 Tax=Nodosilinea sp. LEGE 07088 TaxID=2777968 RepID=UPI0018823961|nr:ribonuclease III [Nodosilinea sp. LEGE 07088]MBE9138707.1 ribonuclease III [Nodosilinea sp. LEGE 07088]
MGLPTFQNSALLRQALTHSSYANEHPTEGPDYERLEFLGDSILELVVRDLLFSCYPAMDEGEMSQRADQLVDEPHLAELAVQLGIPDRMRLGAGAQPERHNPSVQADMFEAVIGAYRLDTNIVAACSYVEAIFRPLVDRVLELPSTDPVTELQEYFQAQRGLPLPEYRQRDESGPDHAKTFTLEVWVGATRYGIGQGSSKKDAKKNAALDALEKLKS